MPPREPMTSEADYLEQLAAVQTEEDFFALLRLMHDHSGMNAKELAQRACKQRNQLSESTVKRIRTGKTFPSRESLTAFLTALDHGSALQEAAVKKRGDLINKRMQSAMPPRPVPRRKNAIIAAVALVATSVIVVVLLSSLLDQRNQTIESCEEGGCPSPRGASTAGSTKGKIVFPTTGAVIEGRAQRVTGTIHGMSPRMTLYCIVRTQMGDYFPYPMIPSGNTWSVNVGTGLPGPQPAGKLTLILATATPEAVQLVQQKSRTDELEYNNHGLGMELPTEFRRLDVVKITRTK